MTLYYNNNPLYGDAGPHEADSPEQLADEMTEFFEEWAEQHFCDIPTDERPEYDPYVAREINRMRAEFIEGLEVVG